MEVFRLLVGFYRLRLMRGFSILGVFFALPIIVDSKYIRRWLVNRLGWNMFKGWLLLLMVNSGYLRLWLWEFLGLNF